MAVYKVIQDIEAEDKLLGPLTLKQFIYACISAGFLFAAFMVATRIKVYAAIPFIPLVVIPGILAAPLGKDQPTDIWLVAQIRFLFKPHKRIWDQNDIKQLVNITAPKKIERQYSDNLTQGEVKSRLKILATTIDSRGWALRGMDPSTYAAPVMAIPDSDRLLNPYANTTSAAVESNISASADIMDAQNNPLAQHFEQMVEQSEQNTKNIAVKKMQQPHAKEPSVVQKSKITKEDIKFMDKQQPKDIFEPDSAMFGAAIIEKDNTKTAKGSKVESINLDEQKLLEKIKQDKQRVDEQNRLANERQKTIKTTRQLEEEIAQKLAQRNQEADKAQAVTPLKNTDIVNLANTNDLSVATIAGIAKRKSRDGIIEGEIKLH